MTILGSGSMLRAGLNPLFFVRDSARLALQNASVFSAINCVSTTAAIPELKLDSVSFLQGKGIVARPCTVVATRTSFSVDPPMGGTALFVSLPAMPATGTSKVIFDRVSIRNMGLSVSGTGDVLNMVNSVVDGSEASFGAAMTFEMSAGGTFLFSTFVNAPMSCGSSASITVSNSIMFGTMANDVLYEISAVCPVHYTLMNPQAAVYTGWDHVLRNVDPLLTSLPNHDFHLPATSPAVDAADPAAVLSTDIEGTARPQGTRLDLGAFEYKKP